VLRRANPARADPPLSSSRQAIRCLVGGRVQGVYYRAATVEQANRLALHGWVRNLPDGRVEAVAAGPAAALSEFASWLWSGPPAARVDSVYVEEWTDAVPDGFTAQR
jgi:acylphosphatase